MAVQASDMTFSGIEHSRSSLVLVFLKSNDIELKSFTDVVIDERTESKATEIKFETGIEEKSLLMNCYFLVLIERIANFLLFLS